MLFLHNTNRDEGIEKGKRINARFSKKLKENLKYMGYNESF